MSIGNGIISGIVVSGVSSRVESVYEIATTNYKGITKTYFVKDQNSLLTTFDSVKEAIDLYRGVDLYIHSRNNEHINFLLVAIREVIRDMKIDLVNG